MSYICSVAKIRSELAREARAKKRNAQLKAQKMEERKYTPKKLGKTKYPFHLNILINSPAVGLI